MTDENLKRRKAANRAAVERMDEFNLLVANASADVREVVLQFGVICYLQGQRQVLDEELARSQR